MRLSSALTSVARKVALLIAVLFFSLGLVTNIFAATINPNYVIDDELFVDTDYSASWIQSKLVEIAGSGGLLANWVDNVDIYVEASRFETPNNRCLVHKATGMTAAEVIYEATTNWQAQYIVWYNNGAVLPSSAKDPGSTQIVDSCSTVAEYPPISGGLKTISPKALFATLQKEQSLMTATGSYSTSPEAYVYCNSSAVCSPSTNEYKLSWAMGYGYAESGPPKYKYKGFYSQLNYGAWQFRANFERAGPDTGWDNDDDRYSPPFVCPKYIVGLTCLIDSTYVTYQNQATASLYRYTPHISGSQSFVNHYENLLEESVFQDSPSLKLVQSVVSSPASPYANNPVTVTFQIENQGTYPIYVGMVLVALRDQSGSNYDYPFSVEMTLQPGATYTYNQSKALPAGSYTGWLASYRNSIGWSNTFPVSASGAIARTIAFTVTENPLVSAGLSLSPTNPAAGQPVTATLTLQNLSAQAVNINQMVVAARSPSGTNVDFPGDSDVVIPAGGTYTYSESRVFSSVGTYSAFIASFNGSNWDMNYPKSASGAIVRSLSFSVKDNPLITTGISLSPSNPAIGQPVTATLTITNAAPVDMNIGSMLVAVRNSSGGNTDFAIVDDVIVPASGTYTYSRTRTFNSEGSYSAFIANWNGNWSTTYPKSADSSVVRSQTFSVQSNPVITTGIGITPGNPTVGQTVTATMTLSNFGPTNINIGSLLIAVRNPSGGNVDFAIVDDVIVPAGGTYTYSKARTFTAAGNHNAFIASWNGSWTTSYPKSSDGSIVRSMTIPVTP